MRLDDLPRSDRVEDRRGQRPGGGFGIPMGRRGGGIGLGTIIILFLIAWLLGINPLALLGLTGGSRQQPQQQSQPAPGPDPDRASLRSDGRVRLRGARKHGNAMEGDLRERRQGLPAAGAGDVLRRYGVRLRSRSGRDGSLLLPDRPEGLPGHGILPGSRAAISRLRRRQQDLPVLPGLRDRARDRSSRTEPARHPAPGAAGAAAGNEQGRLPTICRCGSSCRPIALPECGRTIRRKGGNSSSRATWRRPCRRRPPSATIGCSGRPRVTWCPTPSLTGPRSSARAGS